MPALVILDLMLPGMDGVQLIDAVQAELAIDAPPISVVTAKDLSPQERARVSQSVRHVLKKGTFQGDDLLRIIHSLVVSLPRPALV
jgi:CheY-like chemotaxis protein